MNFKHKKSLGQNFLNDPFILVGVAEDAGVTSEDTVIEVGTGPATLTSVLASRAKRVITYEVDERLVPEIEKALEIYPNATLRLKDAMSDDEPIIDEPFKFVANIPYYITTPLVMKYIEHPLCRSITVMIQKEVADRFVARAGTADYGVITIAIDLVGDATYTRFVPRDKFTPPPKVDSAVVHIEVNRDKYAGVDIARVMKVVKCAFTMRRKTLVNNLTSGYGLTRDKAIEIVSLAGFDPAIRGERLTTEDFIRLTDILYANL